MLLIQHYLYKRVQNIRKQYYLIRSLRCSSRCTFCFSFFSTSYRKFIPIIHMIYAYTLITVLNQIKFKCHFLFSVATKVFFSFPRETTLCNHRICFTCFFLCFCRKSTCFSLIKNEKLSNYSCNSILHLCLCDSHVCVYVMFVDDILSATFHFSFVFRRALFSFVCSSFMLFLVKCFLFTNQ